MVQEWKLVSKACREYDESLKPNVVIWLTSVGN